MSLLEMHVESESGFTLQMGTATENITRFLMCEGGKVAFDDTGGEGPVVLAIPGMGDLRSQYRFLRPLLQQSGYRVITMDVRGCGETSVYWRDYSAKAVGRDVQAILEALEVKNAVIAGNSFAAGAALWAAHEAPGRVSGVALIGPVVRDIVLPWYTKMLLVLGFSGFWRNRFWLYYWEHLFVARKPPDFLQVRMRLKENLAESGRMAALYRMIECSKKETEVLLSQISVPCLIVMGAQDPDFKHPKEEVRWLMERVPSTAVMVTDAGHYPHVEFPEIVAQAMLSFLARLQMQG